MKIEAIAKVSELLGVYDSALWHAKQDIAIELLDECRSLFTGYVEQVGELSR